MFGYQAVTAYHCGECQKIVQYRPDISTIFSVPIGNRYVIVPACIGARVFGRVCSHVRCASSLAGGFMTEWNVSLCSRLSP